MRSWHLMAGVAFSARNHCATFSLKESGLQKWCVHETITKRKYTEEKEEEEEEEDHDESSLDQIPRQRTVTKAGQQVFGEGQGDRGHGTGETHTGGRQE